MRHYRGGNKSLRNLQKNQGDNRMNGNNKWTDFYIKGFDWDSWEKGLARNLKAHRRHIDKPKESMLVETESGLYKDTKTISERLKELKEIIE